MQPNFEWQTEEEQEDVWAPVGPQRKGRRRWPLFLFVLLATAFALFAGYRVLREVEAQADEATAAVRAEVRAGYRLLRRAAENHDRELFLTLLSGRDSNWTTAQVDALQEGVFLDRPGMGLQLLPSHQLTVTVSPDLMAAEVVIRQAYAVTMERGMTETVHLQQSALFRQGEERWLYAPPEDAYQFWGPVEKVQGRLLTLSFPQRDGDISRAFAEDLEELLVDLCALAHFDCPADWRLFVHLESDPHTLLQLTGDGVPEGAQEMTLPAPTLVGLPIDGAGYQALFRGYAGQIVARALADRYPLDECCAYAPFRQALVAWHLAQLDLRPAPLSQADYLRLLERTPLAVRLEAVASALSVTDTALADRVLADVLVEFLMGGAVEGVSPEQVLASPAVTPENITVWFAGRTFRSVDGLWRDFLFEQAAAAQEVLAANPPIPLPEQDLLLACGDDAGRETVLVRYDLAEQRWYQLHTFDGKAPYVSPLPGDQGALFYVVPEGETAASSVGRTVLWRPEEALVLGSVRGQVISPLRGWRRGAEDPRGEVVTIFSRSDQGELVYWLLSLSDCSADGCDVQEVPGLPIWSPDGRRAVTYGEGLLHVSAGRDGDDWSTLDGRMELRGHPAWLGEKAVAYRYSTSTVWARPVEGGAMRNLIRSEDFLTLLPEVQQQPTLEIDDFHVYPADPNKLLVAVGYQGERSMVFRVQRPADGPSFFEEMPHAGEIELLWEVDDPSFRMTDLTRDGRWLIAETFAEDPTFLVYDVSRRQRALTSPNNFPAVGGWDISAGDRWLVHVRAGFVEMVALAVTEGEEELYRRFLFPDYDVCSGAAWMNFPETDDDETSSYSNDEARPKAVSGKVSARKGVTVT